MIDDVVKRLLVIICLVASSTPASAQEPYNLTAPVSNLATLFHDLYGAHGLIVDSEATLPGEQPHSAHFTSDFQFNFSQFNTALVNHLVTVPLPSPAAGFTYEFDASIGVFRRTTQSFGPILAERAETIGARRVSTGFAIQHFSFSTVEGLDLGAVPAVFTHDNAQLLRRPRGRRDDAERHRRERQSVHHLRDGRRGRPPGCLARGARRVHEPDGGVRCADSAPGHDQPADPLLPAIGRFDRHAPPVHGLGTARAAWATSWSA